MRVSTRIVRVLAGLVAALACRPGAAADVDRAAAEWVLHVGGSVVLAGRTSPVWDITQLPATDFELRSINLSGSLVGPMDLARIGNLPHLKELYLCGRTWHSLPVTVTANSLKLLQGLTSLERLILSLPVQAEIPMEDPAIANLAPLVHLKELRLAQTRVKGRTLAPFTEMRSLDLTNTRLDDEGMRSLRNMKHLEKLYAHDALISDEGLQYIKDLHELTELDLYAARITDAGLVYLKDLSRLRKLNLLGAAITDAGLDQLAGLTHLEELNLYRTRITNAGLEKLKGNRNLRQIDVRYTAASRGGVSALQKANPGLRIEFMDASVASSAPRAAAGKDAQSIASWVRSVGGTVVVEQGQIREVSLIGTPTTDADLANLRGLLAMRKLNLRGTQVGDVGLAQLALDRCALTEVELANTTVSDTGLSAFARCSELRRLGVGYTLVRGEGLGKLPAENLRELDCTGNSFSEEGLKALAGLKSVQHLELKYSDIADQEIAGLQSLTNLKHLDLTSTDIGDAGMAALKSLVNLEELLLNYGRFTDKGLEALRSLPKLTRLELVRTRTSDKAMEAIGQLKNLRSLKLDYTTVSDRGLAALATLPELSYLTLDSAGITDAGIASLETFRQLKTLNVYHTLATEKAVDTLKKALPGCSVTWDRGSNLPIRRGS